MYNLFGKTVCINIPESWKINQNLSPNCVWLNVKWVVQTLSSVSWEEGRSQQVGVSEWLCLGSRVYSGYQQMKKIKTVTKAEKVKLPHWSETGRHEHRREGRTSWNVWRCKVDLLQKTKDSRGWDPGSTMFKLGNLSQITSPLCAWLPHLCNAAIIPCTSQGSSQNLRSKFIKWTYRSS